MCSSAIKNQPCLCCTLAKRVDTAVFGQGDRKLGSARHLLDANDTKNVYLLGQREEKRYVVVAIFMQVEALIITKHTIQLKLLSIHIAFWMDSD